MNKYVAIARPDHWFKNIFVLPGVIVAALFCEIQFSEFFIKLILGTISVCSIASANYVINEWLDAKFDRLHPQKKARPLATGIINKKLILTEYFTLSAIGLIAGYFISINYLVTTIVFTTMGAIYNIKPIRAKDVAILDVLVESFNNPLRFTLGWFIVASAPFPPSSLLISYWMAGAFLMALKRYAELITISNYKIASTYRNSFKYYTEKNLLVLSFFYMLTSGLFLGVFLVKYRVELILSFPFVAGMFSWYFAIAQEKDSVVQHPEHLYKKKGFLMYIIFLCAVFIALFAFDIPGIHWFLDNAFISK